MPVLQRRSSTEDTRPEQPLHCSKEFEESHGGHSSTLRRRITRLGPSSLASLCIGGLILTLVGINVLAGPMNAYPSKSAVAQPLGVGSTWNIQLWLAITGVGFGLTSHGFSEASIHLFDWWCSRQARSKTGLDYARYLNTQPRAPVAYGIRGFPAFATLRYFIIAMSAATSVGYKFGFLKVIATANQALDPTLLQPYVNPRNLNGLDVGRQLLPWLSDTPGDSSNRQFFHKPALLPDDYIFNSDEAMDLRDSWQRTAPYTIVMVGEVEPDFDLFLDLSGSILSRDMVMLAAMKEEDGEFTMQRDDDAWFRVDTASTQWFSTAGENAIVEYRISKPGAVQIQWAKSGEWLINQSSPIDSEPVASRLTYEMRYAVAEVERDFRDFGQTENSIEDDFGFHWGLRLLAADNSSALPIEGNETALKHRLSWINGLISEESSNVASGVSVIVRAAMAGWAAEGQRKGEETSLRPLSSDNQPFGPEDDTGTRRLKKFPDSKYPLFLGNRERLTGCIVSIAAIVFVIGILALLTLAVRMIVGPAELTSWTGQHIFLLQAGLTPDLKDVGGLESGYNVAPASGLGRLVLHGSLLKERDPVRPSEGGEFTILGDSRS